MTKRVTVYLEAALHRALRLKSAETDASMSHALWLEARNVTAGGVRAMHPDWSDEDVAARVRELMRDAGA